MPTLRSPVPDGGQAITRRFDMTPASGPPHRLAPRQSSDPDIVSHARHEKESGTVTVHGSWIGAARSGWSGRFCSSHSARSVRDAWHIQWMRFGTRGVMPAGGRAQEENDQGDVVAGAAADSEVRKQSVGETFGAVAGMAGESVGEALQAGIDVLTAAFDETVGVE